MGDIINIARNYTEKRNSTMDKKYDKIISIIRTKNMYYDMPGAADALLALLEGDEYPVPIIALAQRLGFKVFDADMEDEELSGMISINEQWKKKLGTSKVILVNKKDSSEHKRFTIAHELAHYLFDATPETAYSNTYRTDESKWCEDGIDSNDREMVANYFAANLLMPSVAFRRKYNELALELGLEPEEVKKRLSLYFGVPETAVGIRYSELKIN